MALAHSFSWPKWPAALSLRSCDSVPLTAKLPLVTLLSAPLWFRRINWDIKRLERFRESRLRKVVSSAYQNVPAYRDLMDEARVLPEDVRSFEDLGRLPLIDKTFFRSRPLDDLCSKTGLGELMARRTSGSTGVPLLFVHSRRNRWKRIIVDLRANLHLGLRARDIHLVVASPEAQKRGRNVLQRFGFFRREYVSADESTEAIAERIEALNPHLLQCYPSHLLLLAEIVGRRRLTNLRRIISAGEVLTDEARARMEEGFGAVVTNYYGLKELGMIAWECLERKGMHINWDLYHVEEMPDSHELVVTLLDDDAMPFIRYNTLDRGRLEFAPCPCGCSFPRIVQIEGRSDDFIVTADGRRIPPLQVNFVDFTGHTQADAYQVRQERPGHIQVLLVPTKAFDMQSCEKRIRRDIDEFLGFGLTFEIKLVESIPRERSGKLRSVVSFVDSNKQQ